MTINNYNGEYCNKLHSTIDIEITKINKILEGNGNPENSLIFRTQTMWTDYLLRKKTSMGYIDWVYRCFIGILITYVAVKLGLTD